MSEHRLIVNRLSKRYLIPAYERQRRKHGKREIWALKDVSFELEPGKTLGIVGNNGAGKSTLAKILAGTLVPDSGLVDFHGRIATLDVGAAFQPTLSGLENIRLSATLLGLSKSEIQQRQEAIIDFAGIPESIHDPISSYSTGMRARLTMAIALEARPDLLILDEIFAVGDRDFAAKSSRRMRELINSGLSVVLISHSMDLIQTSADQAIWLDKGQLRETGNPQLIVQNYIAEQDGKSWFNESDNRLLGAETLSFSATGEFNFGEELTVYVQLKLPKTKSKRTVKIKVFDGNKITLVENSFFPDSKKTDFKLKLSEITPTVGPYRLEISLAADGKYSVIPEVAWGNDTRVRSLAAQLDLLGAE